MEARRSFFFLLLWSQMINNFIMRLKFNVMTRFLVVRPICSIGSYSIIM